MNRKITAIVCIILLAVSFGTVQAKVTKEEAAKLKDGTLTPMGAEMVGNADGTIPAWEAGKVALPPWKPGEFQTSPFKDEKPVFTITTENYKDYADKLSDGQILMFEKKIPNWKMTIYKTHRIVEMPDYVEDNTYKAALNAELTESGTGVTGACGGIPFPIPKSGLEVIQNYLMRYWGRSIRQYTTGFSGYKNSPGAVQWGTLATIIYPYYQEGSDCSDPRLFYFTTSYTEPARRKGEIITVHDFLDQQKNPRQAWQYIPGQRRVRRAPTIAFDTPDMNIQTYEEAYFYNGSPEKFNWKLIGKKEIYIPYYNYWLEGAVGRGELTPEDMSPGYPEKDIFRWELHRCWVVEATKKPEERHIYARRILYIDEDSWQAALQDRFDAKGNLWRAGFCNVHWNYAADKTVMARPYLTKDFLSGEYLIAYLSQAPMEFLDPPPPIDYFTAAGMRKRAKR